MRNWIPALLSRDWAGVPIAALILLASLACCLAGAATVGAGLLGIGLLLLAGALYHMVRIASIRAKFAPPGKLVDVGGYRLHVLAEGEVTHLPAIVWMPGAHSGGLALHHLHQLFRGRTRSILIDRAGTGWSDVGPFPRSTALEAQEIVAALENAGERGPFVLAGHSFGGLLVANIARRRPDLVCGLVLLDATHFDFFNYGPACMRPTMMCVVGNLTGLLHLFGIHADLFALVGRWQPDVARLYALVRSRLTDAISMGFEPIEWRASAGFSSASALSELSVSGSARSGFDAHVHDGELDGLPVFVVTPSDPSEMRPGTAQAAQKLRSRMGVDEAGFERYLAIMTAVRRRYLATSTRSEQIFAPAGNGHNFPYESPAFVEDVVDRMLHVAAITLRHV
ncbi:hypothetical protein PAN31117_02405 [Pandoraea anapnoica]|uniref:AB hydrolase-1 domain-containing protein n=1 Tax=Pandoraea anapnoica TaxID=2508301 RepID=A0A5E5A1A1_9BURK|nr:alpha/beta hydrolase [Pandoraea anapnoica]VVE66837.1 hypothetical protein PAN31117_02405 [Pandoraea anapnoica]